MAGTLPTDTNNIVYEGLRDATGQAFVAKAAGTVTTDGGGVKSAPQLMASSDGAQTTIGSTTDTAYTGSGSSSVVAALKGLYARLLLFLFDGNGYLQATLGTRIAGEDIANDVMKTERQYHYNAISTAATTTVKSGPGFLHALTINNPGTAASVTLYDNTSATGTPLATIAPSAVVTLSFNVLLTTGLLIVTTGTTAPNITVSYR